MQFKVSKVIPYTNRVKRQIPLIRPISVLSHLNKIVEQVVHKRLIDYSDKYNILNENQFGCRKKFSTNLVLLDLYEQLLQNKENGLRTVFVFPDLKKAFDSVNHSILIKKMNHSGIRG